jgi:membrane protease YdiL (CAAX protease family)
VHLRELRMDRRAVVAIVATTLLLTVAHYHTFFQDVFASFIEARLATQTLLYLVIPLLIILLVFRESPARYGLRIGDWRAGLVLTVLACAGLAAAMLFIARTQDFRSYYGNATSRGSFPFWLADGIELFGWEFFFRGFLLFALYRTCGPLALVLQAVPFTLAHLGKPELETLSCIFGGTAFGYVAWRTRSSLYPFLIHWFLSSFTALVASGTFAIDP